MEAGWILAPKETEKAFLQRKETFEQVSLPKEKNLSVPLYDLQEIEACVLYSSKSLWPWQGAVLWEYQTEEGRAYPVLQLKKSILKGCFGIYKKDELLSHELVHFARFAFKEPFFEEMLAYQTSPQILRRFFGPLFVYPAESAFFALASLLAPLISAFFDSFLGVWLLLSISFFFLVRLLVLHGLFALCRKSLEKIGVLPRFCLPVMVRLSDREIVETALRSGKKTLKYFEVQSRKDLRILNILRSYLKKSRG